MVAVQNTKSVAEGSVEVKAEYIKFPDDGKELIYKHIVGKSGKTWAYPVSVENCADHVYVSASPQELTKGYRGFVGFGGAVLEFPLLDGRVLRLKGPWHANPDGLFEDTGVDIRAKHYTRLILAKDTGSKNVYELPTYKDVVYVEKEPVLGEFTRAIKIAQDFANRLNTSLYYFIQSKGGSNCGFIEPTIINPEEVTWET